MAYDGGTAVVHVLADAKGLSASLAAVSKSATAAFGKIGTAVNAQLASGASAVGAALSTTATIAGVALAALSVKGVAQFQELASEVRTLEKQLGLTAEEASGFHAQATALGLSVDKLSVGFGIFSKNLANASPQLEKYGITAIRAANGQVDFTKTLDEVRGKFQDLAPGIDRTAFAMNVFGRSGKALIPFLSASSEELQKFKDNAEAAGLIMSEEDVQAARDFGIAQRELGEATKGLGVSLGRALIPMLTGAADALSNLIRFISPLLPLLRDLGVLWLAYKLYTFIPGLLALISLGLQAVAVATGAEAAAMGAAAFATAAFSTALLPIVATVGLVVGALLIVTGVLDSLRDKIDDILTNAFQPLADAQTLAALAGIPLARALKLVAKAAEESADGTVDIAAILGGLTTHLDKAGQAARNFAGMTRKALADFKQGVRESVQVAIGDFKNLNEAFKTTPIQLRNQARAAVRVAQTMHADLAKIFGSKDLTDKQKQALAGLSADQRHAWAEGGKAVREQITNDATKLQRLNDQTFNQITTHAKRAAGLGGHQTGAALIQGMINGANAKTGSLTAAISSIVDQAIQAAKDEAQVQSPSKRTIVLGEEIINGIIAGMNKQLSALARMATKVADVIQKALDDEIKDAVSKTQLDFAKGLSKRLEQAANDLDKLVSKFRDFKDSIRSGFDSLGDFGSLISGGVNDYLDAIKAWNEASAAGEDAGAMPAAFDIAGAIQAQVAQAQQLAQLLADAAKAGLSKGLLAQFAGQGAAAIPALQELLANPELIGALNQAQQQIAKAAGDTAEALGEKFFGAAIKKASRHLDHLSDALVRFVARLQRLFGDVSAGIQTQLNAIQQQAQQAAQGTGGGGGGTTGGGGTHHGSAGPWSPTNQPPQGGGGGGGHGNKPNVTVNVTGWVGNDQALAEKVRNELIRVGRNNGGTGL